MDFRRVSLFLLLVSASALGGCARDVTRVTATSDEVAIHHKPERAAAADRLAAATCADYGRRARLRYRHDQPIAMDQFGIYDCVPR